jgi:LPS-assembly lipoprotein
MLLLATSWLAACGFRPVYAPSAGSGEGPAASGLAEITVGLIPERTGQLLRLALQERFERAAIAAAHRYDLTVSFGIAGEAIGYQPDSTVTRVRLVGTATYTLTAQDPTRSTLKTGVARVVDGYDIFDQQYFASDQETESVERRMAEAVADQIALQLAAFFDKRAASAVG